MRNILVILAIAASAWAQDYRATITGQVTDRTGAAIPNARVKAIQISTSQTTVTTTNQDGYYSLSYLTPSDYTVEVEAEGFNGARNERVTLLVAAKQDLPFRLEVGKVSEKITVTAEAGDVQTADASGGLNFDSLQTSEYPLNGRQVY